LARVDGWIISLSWTHSTLSRCVLSRVGAVGGKRDLVLVVKFVEVEPFLVAISLLAAWGLLRLSRTLLIAGCVGAVEAE
jgi:hypothetical protein